MKRRKLASGPEKQATSPNFFGAAQPTARLYLLNWHEDQCNCRLPNLCLTVPPKGIQFTLKTNFHWAGEIFLFRIRLYNTDRLN